MRKTTMLAAVAMFGVAGTSQAAEIFKDYVPSKAIWNVTMVKVNPNRIDDYLGGLRQSWVPGCDINKKLGVIEDCSIFVSETTAGGPFNVMLVQKFPSSAAAEPNAEYVHQDDGRGAQEPRRRPRKTRSSRATRSSAPSGVR